MSTDTNKPRRGDWVQFYPSGKIVYPLDPRVEDYSAEDFAHALAIENRYGGHSRVPISVAEHSLRVADVVRADAVRAGLSTEDVRRVTLAATVHDASEGTGLRDMPSPVKRDPIMRDYCIAHDRTMAHIELWAGLSADAHKSSAIKRADLILLATEKRDLTVSIDKPWALPYEPLPEKLVSLDWREAEVLFLAALRELLPPLRFDHRHRCSTCHARYACGKSCSTFTEDEHGIPFGVAAACDDCAGGVS